LFILILSNPEILYGYSYLQTELSKNNSDSISNNYWNIHSKIQINNNQDQLLKEKISSKIERYLSELNTLLYKNSYFKNPKFSMKDLSLVLNIPISHLKYIFKYHSKLSFSDYKKISRIQNSLELIKNNYLATNTLESLSKEVGFSSYNPFFTCFKDVVGKSPHQYISTLKGK
jgi:AraC-like DNA-binding protein